MKQLLLILLLAASPTPSWAMLEGASAYNRLRQQFRLAEAPTLEQLQPGETWHCSASLNAAKGLYRFVNYWQERFQFEIQASENQLLNSIPESAEVFLFEKGFWHGSYRSFLNEFLQDSLRINSEGDLLVEVNSSLDSEPLYSQAEHIIKPSLTHKGKTAQAYLVCENPISHKDKKWERNRGNFFSEGTFSEEDTD